MNLGYQKSIYVVNYLDKNLIFELAWSTAYSLTCSPAWATQSETLTTKQKMALKS